MASYIVWLFSQFISAYVILQTITDNSQRDYVEDRPKKEEEDHRALGEEGKQTWLSLPTSTQESFLNYSYKNT